MNIYQALNAIAARKAGEFDNPDLKLIGPLTTEADDITEIKRRFLVDWCGFVVGLRDPRLNTDFPGQFMVVDDLHEESELPTRDGSNGPWCIVGDDLAKLIDEAFECHSDWGL
jgi:hypothetical protein